MNPIINTAEGSGVTIPSQAPAVPEPPLANTPPVAGDPDDLRGYYGVPPVAGDLAEGGAQEQPGRLSGRSE